MLIFWSHPSGCGIFLGGVVALYALMLRRVSLLGPVIKVVPIWKFTEAQRIEQKILIETGFWGEDAL